MPVQTFVKGFSHVLVAETNAMELGLFHQINFTE